MKNNTILLYFSLRVEIYGYHMRTREIVYARYHTANRIYCKQFYTVKHDFLGHEQVALFCEILLHLSYLQMCRIDIVFGVHAYIIYIYYLFESEFLNSLTFFTTFTTRYYIFYTLYIYDTYKVVNLVK